MPESVVSAVVLLILGLLIGVVLQLILALTRLKDRLKARSVGEPNSESLKLALGAFYGLLGVFIAALLRSPIANNWVALLAGVLVAVIAAEGAFRFARAGKLGQHVSTGVGPSASGWHLRLPPFIHVLLSLLAVLSLAVLVALPEQGPGTDGTPTPVSTPPLPKPTSPGAGQRATATAPSSPAPPR